MRKLAALVLAAGESARMGTDRNKLLEPISGRPLVYWPVAAALTANLPDVFVVTGFEADRIENALSSERVTWLRHAEWQKGMASSIAAGVQGLEESAEDFSGVLILLGDLPGLSAQLIQKLIGAFEALPTKAAAEASIVVPLYRGQQGHPVLFGRRFFETLRSAGDQGAKTGARSIIETNPDCVISIEVDHDSILRDIDTPADLVAAQRKEAGSA